MSAEWFPITTAPRDGSTVQLRSQAFGASPLPFRWDVVKRGWRKGNWLHWWFEDALGPEEWRPYTITTPEQPTAERATRAEAEAAALREKVEEMREALRPFAEDASEWADQVVDDYRPKCCEPGNTYAHPGSEAKFSVGDLRRAAALLPTPDAGTGEDPA